MDEEFCILHKAKLGVSNPFNILSEFTAGDRLTMASRQTCLNEKTVNRLFNPIAVTTELKGAVTKQILKFDGHKIIKSFAFASSCIVRLSLSLDYNRGDKPSEPRGDYFVTVRGKVHACLLSPIAKKFKVSEMKCVAIATIREDDIQSFSLDLF